MKRALGFAALLAGVACGGEARKLGEVDVGVGGSSTGGVFDTGGTFASGGTGEPSAGMGPANGGTPVIIGPGSGGAIIDTGGQASGGGAVAITTEEHTALAASACVGVRSEPPQEIPVQMQLMVDGSASMGQPVAGYNGLSKWQVTRDALLDAVVGMSGPGLPADVSVGLLVYPKSGVIADSPECIDSDGWVTLAPLGPSGSAQRTLIASHLVRPTPKGFTPTFDTYDNVSNHGFPPHETPGPRVIVLVTDGYATTPECIDPALETGAVDPEPITAAIADAHAMLGIRTVVVGTPGSEANRRWLSDAALHGGTAAPGCSAELGNCHVDLTMSTDLSSALNAQLQTTVGSSTSCSLRLPAPPTGQSLASTRIFVVLSADGQSKLLNQSTASDCAVGWRFVDSDTIQLCSDSCEETRTSTVDVYVDCAVTAK
jgi:hypothetical protein